MLRTARPKATATRRRRPGASSSPTGGAAPRRASQRSDSGRVRRIAVTSSAGSPERMNAARQPILGATKLPTSAASPTPTGAPVWRSAPQRPRSRAGTRAPRRACRERVWNQVILCLREQDLRVEIGGLVEKFLQARFFRVELLFLCLVVVHDGLGHLWIGLVMRTGEDAGEAVVIARRDSVVLVIMAAGAPYGQAEKRLCRYVKLVVPFVGALDGGGVVLITP